MKRLLYIIPLLAAGSIFFLGSRKHSLNTSEYVHWVENKENGLRVNKIIGNVAYSIQYKPVEYIVFKEERNLNPGKQLMEKRKQELNKMEHFTLRINSKNKQDVASLDAASKEEYYQRLQYFSFDFQNDLFLVQGIDTVPCSFFQSVPNYGLAPFMEFMIGFEKPRPDSRDADEQDKTLIMEDRIFKNGTVQINVNKESIKNIPIVNI